MIAGTPYSPQKAFVAFARDFLDSLASDKFGQAFSKLDQSSRKWTKAELRSAIHGAIGDVSLVPVATITRSAEPELDEVEPGIFVLRHSLPLQSGWSAAWIGFRFSKKPGTEYFHVTLDGVNA